MMNLERKEQFLIIIVLAIILFSAGYQFANPDNSPVELVGPNKTTGEETSLVVHVDGAVQKPGLYKFPPASRVNDALEQAVALPEADLSNLNLAAPLKDGQKLVVAAKLPQPAVGTIPTATSGALAPVPQGTATPNLQAGVKAPGLVNINIATETELDTLPGIGPTLANRIVQHRQANGTFATIEDLKNVSGIGDKKFEDLKDRITVQ